MRPVAFPEANGSLLGGPAEKFDAAADVADLPVCRSGSEIISCWKLSWRDSLRLLFTRKVWLLVMAQRTHAPVCVSAERPFE